MIRVLVVDDEDVIRKGIVKLVPWKKYGCTVVQECSNGKDALEYLEQYGAELLVADIRMPVMDGIELLKQIQQKKLAVTSILLTAFAEFQYVQSALRYGVLDFVSKSDFAEELPLAIQKAVDRIGVLQREAESQKLHSQERKSLLEALVFQKRTPDDRSLQALQAEIKNCCVGSCEIELGNKNKNEFYTQLEALWESAAAPYSLSIVAARSGDLVFILTNSGQNELTPLESRRVSRDMLHLSAELLGCGMKMGVSDILQDVDALPTALAQAENALSHAIHPQSEIIEFAGMVLGDSVPIEYQETTRALFEKIVNKQEADAEKEIENLKVRLQKSHFEFEQLRAGFYGSLVALFAQKEYLLPEEAAKKLQQDTFAQMHVGKTVYSLFKNYLLLLNALSNLVQKQNGSSNHLIVQVYAYLQKNYTKNPSLQEIAEYVHVSGNYISRLYRNKMGCTVTEALNRLRVEQAKKELKNTNKKVYQIAQDVGFVEAAYFTNVFIKFVGCSPLEYRNM